MQLLSFCDGASQTEVVELKPAVQQEETGWFSWIQDLKEYVRMAHRYVSHVITARHLRVFLGWRAHTFTDVAICESNGSERSNRPCFHDR